MSNKIALSELDVIFISYDEPNADENWADLQNKCPWAKRSHGVFGSDAAHKAAAQLSETDRFITIDGDNIIDPNFFNLEISVTANESNRIYSWAATNMINGLVYGNGGIKVWPVEAVMKMKTHEISENPECDVDFCWDLDYQQINKIYSETHINASPYQAFRAGFREGVKMGLDEGRKVTVDEFHQKVYPENLKRLRIWCSIGADVENGLWAIYGTRLGCYKSLLTDWDHKLVRDFEQHTKHWNEEIEPKFKGGNQVCPRTGYTWTKKGLLSEISMLGDMLNMQVGLDISLLDENQSRFFKSVL